MLCKNNVLKYLDYWIKTPIAVSLLMLKHQQKKSNQKNVSMLSAFRMTIVSFLPTFFVKYQPKIVPGEFKYMGNQKIIPFTSQVL